MKAYTTESIETLKFRPHGKVELTTFEDRIVVYRAHGPFNKELAEALATLETSVYEEYKKRWKAWGDICLFVDSSLVMQDAVDYYQGFLKSCAASGLAPQASAFVFDQAAEGALIARDMYKQMYQFAGIRYKEFGCFKDAVVWLKDQLK